MTYAKNIRYINYLSLVLFLRVDFNKAEVSDYFDNFFDFKYALENLFGRKVDLLEEQTIKNPYLKKNVDATKTLIYG